MDSMGKAGPWKVRLKGRIYNPESCQLKSGPCHQPLHGVKHEPLQRPTCRPLSAAQGGDQDEALCALGEPEEQVFRWIFLGDFMCPVLASPHICKTYL